MEKFSVTPNHPGLILAGHSMGGAIVQTITVQKLLPLKGIILVGTGAKLTVNPMIFQLIDEDFPNSVSLTVGFAYAESAPEALIEAGKVEMLKNNPQTVYDDFKACDAFDLRNEVGGIGIPTAILCGEEDRLTPKKYSEYLHEKIAGSEMLILPGAGHMVLIERFEAANEFIRGFLKKLS
jgi:pimeloyl-ACP methyl ester carboxylesterase